MKRCMGSRSRWSTTHCFRLGRLSPTPQHRNPPTDGYRAGMLGLADASIFLNQTVSAGVSPSRSWAFDYGLTANNVPGELVIGGYNPSKATYDKFTNYTVFPDKSKPCPLQVNVKGMKWGSVDLMDGQGKPYIYIYIQIQRADADAQKLSSWPASSPRTGPPSCRSRCSRISTRRCWAQMISLSGAPPGSISCTTAPTTTTPTLSGCPARTLRSN